MRVGTLFACCVILAACSQISGPSPIPIGQPNTAPLAGESGPFGRYLSLYSFHGRKQGGAPQAELVAVNGNLYGTTSSYGRGYGTVFQISRFGGVKVLHSFGGFPDGAYPLAGLIWFKGALYGTTSAGGTHGGGTVFAVTLTGSESVIHNFGKPGDGTSPAAALMALNGVFYGTTEYGGRRNRGTVFELTPTGEEHVLHSFIGAPTDGGHPTAALIAVKGVLYGTARAGGKVASGGCVFKVTRFGAERVLHSFRVKPADGANPAGSLVYLNGTIYGTTLHGGAFNNRGTIFAMTRQGREAVIHDFGSGMDGAFPAAGLTAFKGELYGTTFGGGVSPKKSNECISSGASEAAGYFKCGTIFKVSQFGGERVLYRFKGYPDGANPEDSLTNAGGALYGTTYWGGSGIYYGTVFRIFP